MIGHKDHSGRDTANHKVGGRLFKAANHKVGDRPFKAEANSRPHLERHDGTADTRSVALNGRSPTL